MSILASVVGVLEQAGIAHALIGATALAVHGVARATMEIDLLVVGPAPLDPTIWEAAGGQDVRVDVRRGAADDPLLGVVRVSAPGQAPVDLIVGDSAWQRDAIARAGRVQFEGVDVSVVDAADLVLLKLYAAGPQDLSDIRRLLAASDEDALTREVENRLERVPPGCRRLWRSLREAVPER